MKNKETNKNSKRILAILISFILIISIVCGLGLMIGRKTYQVKFYSDNDIVLKVDEVKRNDFAIPPKEPQISYGKIFKSWDKDLSKIRKNIDIYPVCEDVLSKKNAFVIPGAYGIVYDEIVLPVQLCGEVCVSGFDISISYDSDVLQLKEILDKDEDVMVNSDEPGIIKLNFISTENTIGDVDMCKLKFIINSKTESTPIKIKVNSIYAFEDSKKLENDKLIKPEYYIVDSNVVVLP